MITKEQALSLYHGQVLHHVSHTNSDGSPERWRVNGKCKTWKTRPNHFQVPLKNGLYSHAYLTHDNCHVLFIPTED